MLGVVNNFGIARHERFEGVTDVDFMALLGSNLRPALQITQALLPGMRDAKFERVVNVGSLTTRGLPYRAGYAAAKSALESLTRTIAIEYAAYGITANVVAPDPTETELFRANNQPGSDGGARYLAGVPVGRFGRPEEIAAAISFFCSDLASFITGQSLFIDGGSSLGKG
ncbi:3-oxoacyl-ACP reductase [Asaia siamensis]|uniref:3-oxoacyl-ACP reductase n=1 Tax=Asaia siamensis TaxID=110479 RepID=A0ABQ1M2I5_9PROT|nr:3-oxoacyl-ACP reductase [Asaia siamensis NRIC 0323]GGC33226.1 3-oxoacyl-ACP reductase [Asaia siamensis]